RSVLAGSFLRYVIDVSDPPCLDDTDRDLLAFFAELAEANADSVGALTQLLVERETTPPPTSFPLAYTSFNYLRPRYLLRPLRDRMASEVDEVLELVGALRATSNDASVDAMLERVFATEKTIFDRIERKLVELPPERPVTSSAPKGTSASRW